MKIRPWSAVHASLALVGTLLGALLGLAAGPLAAEIWRSPLHTLSYLQIEKRLHDPLLDAEEAALLPPAEVHEPLPANLAARLGDHAVDYDGFAAAYLPAAEAASLAADARAQGLVVLEGIDRQVALPWHAFEAGDTTHRSEESWTAEPPGQPIPGLFLLQFAYPVRPEWLAELQACNARPVAFFQSRVVLLQAPTLAAVLDCKTERYHSWIDAYLSTGVAVTTPGYRNWLQARGLLTPANQQIVGIIDTGYDDGRPLSSSQHPDLENPERLIAPVRTESNAEEAGADRSGHGTLVAGIIAGDGTHDPARGLLGTGGKDPQGYLYGLGVAPTTRLVMAQLPAAGPFLQTRTAELANGLDF